MQYNVAGSGNTAIGAYTLHGVSTNSADYNTAVGDSSSYKTTTGGDNASLGYKALYTNTTGTENTAIGYGADVSSGTLTNATAIGYNASVTSNNTIQLGNSSLTNLYIGTGSLVSGLTGNPLEITSGGRVWVGTSSRRYKKDIKDLNIDADLIYKLRPVTYVYKADTSNTPVIGLIAEEVAQVIPDLAIWAVAKDVIKGSTSDSLVPNGVQFNGLSVLLLKEVQKHEKTIAEQQHVIDSLKKINAIEVGNIKSLQTAQTQIKQEQDNKLTSQENKMATQEKEIAELKKLVYGITQTQASAK